MNITFPIICYFIREMFPNICENQPIKVLKEQCGSPDLDISHFRVYESNIPLRSDTLYLLSCSQIEHLSSSLPQEPLQFLAMTQDDTAAPLSAQALRKKDNILFCSTQIHTLLLLEHIEDMVQTAVRWDISFDRDILSQEDPQKLFSRGRELLFRDYAIIDIDMNVSYCTRGYAESRSVQNGRMSEEIFQDLISHRDFHEAASKTGCFYFNNAQAGTDNLCHNIFVNEQYIARLVMILDDSERSFHEGGKQIFQCFAEHIRDVFIHMNLVPAHHTEDEMHRMCQAILSGTVPEEKTIENILSTYRWNINDKYAVIVLRFSVGKEWNPHLHVLLPHLAASLEGLWLQSCAVYNKEQITLILNINTGDSAESKERFLQSLAYFVRDNVCKAGISPVFSDFSLLLPACTAAEAALNIGSDRNPHFWYYYFEKYRLEFTKQALLKALPAPLLSHPALDILEKYDRQHDSSLTETLSVYLNSGQNATKCAEKLFIHRTSFIRRMNQIRKLTGLELNDSEVLFSLKLSFLIRK